MRQNPFSKIYNSVEYKTSHELKFPLIVDIEPTNNCNLKCKMCDRQRMTRPKGFMSMELFKKIADECVKHGMAIRMIGWGEPFLNPNIVEFVKYSKTPIHITNNGQVIKEQQMKDIIGRLDSIIFSFQGATERGYKKMRGADYEKLKNNIFKLVEIRGQNGMPFIHISSTMTNETKEEIDSFVHEWKKVVDSVDTGTTNLHNQKKPVYFPCSEVWHKLSIKWDGQVSACCGDYDNLLIVGDLNKSTIKEVWEGERLKAIRVLLSNMQHKSLTMCKECYHAYHF